MSHAHPLDRFFEAAPSSFAEAVGRGRGAVESDYEIGGSLLRIRFADPEVSGKLGPAIEHLAVRTTATPALTALAWDSRPVSAPLPPPPWQALRYYERGNVRGYLDARFALVLDRGTDVFTAVDNQRRIALYWTRDVDGLPSYELAAPMRHLLQGWAQSRKLFIVHAAAVSHAGGGAVLAGRAGSGKSTTALLCLRSALGYLGDDFVLLGADPPRVYSLYNHAKLTAGGLEGMPELRGSVRNPGRPAAEKALIALDPTSAALPRESPLRIFLLPHVSEQADTTLHAVSPSEAFKAMAPDTIFRALGNAAVSLRGLRELVHHVPCYRLELGGELSRIPDVIANVVARHA